MQGSVKIIARWSHEKVEMFIGGILLFSMLAMTISFAIFKKYDVLEKAELSTYIVFIAWGSLLFGILMARI